MNDIDLRYSRQMLFPPIGAVGQHKLRQSKIAIVGMGALGTVLANHMVRAGVGFVRIIDRDFVEMSNLQRQMLYNEENVRQAAPKAFAAAEALRLVNSSVDIEPYAVDLNPTNAEQLLGGVDLILDGTDNFTVRFLINDISIKLGIPWIYGGAVSSRGVVMNIVPERTPCLRCLFPQPPEQGTTDTCDTAGVIGPIIHIVASYQAVEALKMLVGDWEHVNPSMLHFDLWSNFRSEVSMSSARRPDCPACSRRHFEYLEAEMEEDTIQSLCGRDSVQIVPLHPARKALSEWAERLKPLGKVEHHHFLLKFFVDDQITMVIFPEGRVLIQGTNDPSKAKSLYSRFIGM